MPRHKSVDKIAAVRQTIFFIKDFKSLKDHEPLVAPPLRGGNARYCPRHVGTGLPGGSSHAVAMPETITSLKLALIEGEITQYSKQYQAISAQILRTLNEADKIPLYEQLEQIEQKVAAREQERQRLQCANSTPTPMERDLSLKAHLHKIDFEDAQNTLRQLLKKTNAALLLLQESRWYCGDLCVAWMKQHLKEQTGQFKPYRIELGPSRPPNEFGLLEGVGGHLNAPRHDAETCAQYAARLLEKLAASVAHPGAIIFFEFANWDAVARCDQARVFQCFHELFWRPLAQFLAMMAQRGCVNMKCVAVCVSDGAFALPPEFCCDNPDHFSGAQAFALLFKNWKQEEIYNWLINFGGQMHDTAAHWAAACYESSKGGAPHIVRDKIEDILFTPLRQEA